MVYHNPLVDRIMELCKEKDSLTADLGEYRSTGMTAQEIKQVQEAVNPIPFGRFYEIMEAEREGRLKILPPFENVGYKGLKVKYRVFKASDGEVINNCFVLRPDKDGTARAALRCYAVNTANKKLKEDIFKWLDDILDMLRKREADQP